MSSIKIRWTIGVMLAGGCIWSALQLRVWMVAEEVRYRDMLSIGIGLQRYCQRFGRFPTSVADAVGSNDLPAESVWYSVPTPLGFGQQQRAFRDCQYAIRFGDEFVEISIPDSYFSGIDGFLMSSLREDKIRVERSNGGYVLRR